MMDFFEYQFCGIIIITHCLFSWQQKHYWTCFSNAEEQVQKYCLGDEKKEVAYTINHTVYVGKIKTKETRSTTVEIDQTCSR